MLPKSRQYSVTPSAQTSIALPMGGRLGLLVVSCLEGRDVRRGLDMVVIVRLDKGRSFSLAGCEGRKELAKMSFSDPDRDGPSAGRLNGVERGESAE